MSHKHPNRTYPTFPDALSLELFHRPGTDYKDEHPDSQKVLHCFPEHCFHHDYKEAKELAETVINDYTPEKGWLFYAEFICHRHPHLAVRTALGEEIIKFFESAFQIKIGDLEDHDVVGELYNCLELIIKKHYHPHSEEEDMPIKYYQHAPYDPATPEALTLPHIREPGVEYDLKYPDKGLNHFFHTHHKVAKRLANVTIQNYTPQKGWLFLADFLAKLYRVHSFMGQEITRYFEVAFKINVPRPFDFEGNSLEKDKRYRKQLKDFLTSVVDTHFAAKLENSFKM